jgi:hypothetical protein
VTAATGIDAFVHCFEAYCAPGFHPLADGGSFTGSCRVPVQTARTSKHARTCSPLHRWAPRPSRRVSAACMR